MDETLESADNAWSGDRVSRWLRQAEGLDRQMLPVTAFLFTAAEIGAGDAVLDIGCGAGPTTREAAARSGTTGRVTGLDVSADMLAAAAATPGAGAPIDWIEADAVSWAAPVGSYDVVLSRFGVMFFSDPVAAMANLATAARPGARLAFAVWGRREESELFELPYRVAADVRARGDLATTSPSADEGPFSWHDEQFVAGLLASAGWRDIAVFSHAVRLPFAGGLDPERAAMAALDFGPTRTLMADADETTTAAVGEALATAFADHVDAAGHVVLGAAVRIVTARR